MFMLFDKKDIQQISVKIDWRMLVDDHGYLIKRRVT